MRNAVLCIVGIFVFSGCAGIKAFHALERKVNELERFQKLITVVLANTVTAVKERDKDILEIAKAANDLYKHLAKKQGYLMSLDAGLMQNEKNLADLKKRVEELAKRISPKRK
jgi:superfamily II RNA helicase